MSIFQKAMKLADCQPEECFHIGDCLRADIGGANGAGIKSVWISHGQEFDEKIGGIPDFTVSCFMDIEPLLAVYLT